MDRSFAWSVVWMEFISSVTLQSTSYVEIHQKSTEKPKRQFWPNCSFCCNFVWNCSSCLLGCAEEKRATVTLHQCKTIPNSKLQTSCYKDRFMGATLMNFMPFGGCPERLVNDHIGLTWMFPCFLWVKVFLLNARARSYIITPSSHLAISFGLKPNSRLLWMRFFSGWHFVSHLIFLPQMCFFESYWILREQSGAITVTVYDAPLQINSKCRGKTGGWRAHWESNLCNLAFVSHMVLPSHFQLFPYRQKNVCQRWRRLTDSLMVSRVFQNTNLTCVHSFLVIRFAFRFLPAVV